MAWEPVPAPSGVGFPAAVIEALSCACRTLKQRLLPDEPRAHRGWHATSATVILLWARSRALMVERTACHMSLLSFLRWASSAPG